MQVRQSIDFPIFRRSRIKFGIGVNAAIMIWAVGGMSAMMVGMPYGGVPLLICALIHSIATWFYRVDDKVVEMYSDYASTPNEYRAGVHSHGEISSSRPDGFGKNISV